MPQKAIWVKSEQAVIIADVHLGKIEHFRSEGIGLPIQATKNRLACIEELIEQTKAQKIIFLGDLFHSKKNSSFESLKSLIEKYDTVTFILVKGNHDIMPDHSYMDLDLVLVDEYIMRPLWLTHEPQAEPRSGLYNLAGHIHPAVRLKGLGRQSLSLPCFYFGPNFGLLPAFGYFTGKSVVKIEKKSTIFAVAENQIFDIKST